MSKVFWQEMCYLDLSLVAKHIFGNFTKTMENTFELFQKFAKVSEDCQRFSKIFINLFYEKRPALLHLWFAP